MDSEGMRQAVRELMGGNQVESRGYRYTRPAPMIYEQQWLWDSCFHAIVYCHIDPEMAKDELRSLVHHRGVDTGGMIPHMVYWTGGGESLWGREYVSTITQPPLLAYAVLMVHNVTDDKRFVRDIYEPVRDYYDWLMRERDHDGDGLVSIIHPWESGWDASPKWDSLLGLSEPTSDELQQARFALAHRLLGVGHDLPSIVEEGLFNVEAVDYNAIYSVNLAAIAEIASIVGQPGDARRFRMEAEKVNAAVNSKMWDEHAGFYWDLAGTNETPIKTRTAASFIPLFAGIPSKTQADRLVEQMRLHFEPTYPVPTTALDHRTFVPGEYWRGNTWLNVNWFLVLGLRCYGYTEIAERIVRQSAALVEKSGFREYYNPLTGEGLGTQAHSWSGIVLDIMDSTLVPENLLDRPAH